MQFLRNGSRGHQVEYLQRLLVLADTRDQAERPFSGSDGVFGAETERAVRAFQGRQRGMQVDGVAGPRTWAALGLRSEREHHIHRYGQPTRTSCWSAAATMITGHNQSVGQGRARLDGDGGLDHPFENVEAFGRSMGWRMPGATPGVLALVALLQRGPLWIAVRHSTGRHAVVLSGVYSDGNPSGLGTMVRIHDPWPVGSGAVYGSFVSPIILRSGGARDVASLEHLLIPG